jgi:hypothetical protein
MRLFCLRCHFWRLEREGASPAGSRQSFPVFQPVRAAAPVWKRVRRLLQIEVLGGYSWLHLIARLRNLNVILFTSTQRHLKLTHSPCKPATTPTPSTT